jgi:hypothetical protein
VGHECVCEGVQDLEITRGYVPGFNGVPGHEFVGVVERCEEEPALLGKRVVGEINCGCAPGFSNPDPVFSRNHAPGRTVGSGNPSQCVFPGSDLGAFFLVLAVLRVSRLPVLYYPCLVFPISRTCLYPSMLAEGFWGPGLPLPQYACWNFSTPVASWTAEKPVKGFWPHGFLYPSMLAEGCKDPGLPLTLMCLVMVCGSPGFLDPSIFAKGFFCATTLPGP